MELVASALEGLDLSEKFLFFFNVAVQGCWQTIYLALVADTDLISAFLFLLDLNLIPLNESSFALCVVDIVLALECLGFA